MNTQEPINMAKMAVSVLMLCLVLSAGLGIWYLLLDTDAQQTEKFQKAVNSAAADRMKNLVDTSNLVLSAAGHTKEQFPLTTNVINALNELPADGVVYIAVISPSGTDVFCIDGVSLTVPVMSSLQQSMFPVSEAATFLTRNYSHTRCCVLEVPVYASGTNYSVAGTGDTTFLAYEITIQP